MSVQECNRGNCQEISCHILILNHSAYICSTCWGELFDYKETWEKNLSAFQVEELIRQFMRTNPGAHVRQETLPNDSTEKAFKKLTGGGS